MLLALFARVPVCGVAILFVAAASAIASSAAASEPENSGKALELREALARTLESSPTLEIFPYRERAADFRILQAGLRPNPELAIEVENVAGSGEFSGTEAAEVTLALSQLIEFGDKRERRTLLAEMNRERVGVDYDVARLDVLAEAARRFIHVARDQALLALSERRQALADRALDVAEKRVETGRSSSAEASQARIEKARSALEMQRAERELAGARVRLAASWGETDPQFRAVEADLFRFPALPPFETLQSELDRAPDLERYLTLERVRAAELRLTQANGRQDARVGLGVRRFEDSNDHALMLQFSMPLPLSNRNQGNIAAAREELAMTTAERRQARLAIYTTLFGLYQELLLAHAEATILREEVLPEAQRALEQIQSGYDVGRFSYLEMVEARRQRLDVEQDAIEAAASFHTLLLELERLTGTPLVAIRQTADSNTGD